MPYLLDSDVIIDFLKQKDPGYSLVKKICREELFISVITWIEIAYGIKKAHLAPKRLNQFRAFLKDSNIGLIPIDQNIGLEFVDLKISLEDKGAKLADFDLLITAVAKVYKLTLVTRNLKHFERTGLKIFKNIES